MDKQTALQTYFGYTHFRPGQEELIDCLLAGRDALGIMPTGAGKSICYQLPALLMGGVSLVISPLISLMKDQVGALVQAGVPAAYLNSSLTPRQYALALERAAEGRYSIIYVAPERLQTEEFCAFAQQAPVSMVTVDEAHCVSQWGQDFRPSYCAIADFIESLPSRPVVSAFTATATHAVKEDILHLLRLQNPYALTTGFDRKNLYFEVRQPGGKMAELLDIVAERSEKCGIIYCATRKNVEQVCDTLCQRGFAATRYHAGLGDDERRQNQDDFLFDRKTIMVATNAFGMGIDKSNVGYVVHYNMPKNLESYYQEAGRAGRDGEPADCILLYSGQDVHTNQFLIEKSHENEEPMDEATLKAIMDNERDLLRRMTYYATTTGCLRGYILKYFDEGADVYCGHCSNCNTQFEEVDIRPAARVLVNCVHELQERRRSFGRAMLVNIVRGSANERIRSMALDALPSHGGLKDMPQGTVNAVLDSLLNLGALAISQGEYPVVILQPGADEVLAGEGPLLMKLPKPKQQKVAKKAQPQYDIDTALFGRLRELRATLARSAGVPAYLVFADATLRDMCQKRPVTLEAMLEVSGVGQSKLERYGEAFVALIEEYCKENPAQPLEVAQTG